MLKELYAIASISLFLVCEGVTNQNNYAAHATVSKTNDSVPNTDDILTRDSGDPIKFDDADQTTRLVTFKKRESITNQFRFDNDVRVHQQDTRNVVFQDESRPGVNAATYQPDIEVSTRNPAPLRFTDSANLVDTNKLFNYPRPLTFNENTRLVSDTKPASVHVEPLKFADDVTRSPEVNVIGGGASQIVFEEDQGLGVGVPQAAQNQPQQGGQPFEQKKRRRRRRRYRRVLAGVSNAKDKPLKTLQEVLKMVVDNDKKKCMLRMFCEQAYELTTQPKDTVNNLRTAISSMAEFFKVVPYLKENLRVNVDKLGSAMKQFAKAGFTGQTKGIPACRNTYPECPADPIELANYLLSFQGGFTHFFNGENYTMHNTLTLNRELGFEKVKTGREHEPDPVGTYDDPLRNGAGFYLPYNLKQYQQNYQPNYQTNYQQSYQPVNPQSYQPANPQSYQPVNLQSYQPVNPQSYQLSYQQNYQPNSQLSYQPNSQLSYQPSYQQGYQMQQHQ